MLHLGEPVEIETKPSIIALDGERTLEVFKRDDVVAVVTRNAPRVINYRKALDRARALFRNT